MGRIPKYTSDSTSATRATVGRKGGVLDNIVC